MIDERQPDPVDVDTALATGVRRSDGYLVVCDRRLDGLDFSGRALIGIRFERCTLRGTNLSSSDLSYSEFVACDLYRADLSGAVLYTTRFIDTDLTRATFVDSLLSGVRFRDVDCTRTEFGDTLRVGRARKYAPLKPEDPVVELGAPIGDAVSYEADRAGVGVKDFPLWIRLYDDPEGDKRRALARRRAEVAKFLKNMMTQNGYHDLAANYYYVERQERRHAMRHGPRRFSDWFFGDVLWGYGVQWAKALRSLALSIVAISVMYLAVPVVAPGSALQIPGGAAELGLDYSLSENVRAAFYALYFTSTFAVSGPGDVLPTGWARVLAISHLAWFALLITLVISAIARRLTSV